MRSAGSSHIDRALKSARAMSNVRSGGANRIRSAGPSSAARASFVMTYEFRMSPLWTEAHRAQHDRLNCLRGFHAPRQPTQGDPHGCHVSVSP